MAIDGVALRASVLEEFLALGGSDECHVFDSCVGTPAVRSPRTQTAQGQHDVERGSSKPDQQDRDSNRCDSGFGLARRCVLKAHCIVVTSQATRGQHETLGAWKCQPGSGHSSQFRALSAHCLAEGGNPVQKRSATRSGYAHCVIVSPGRSQRSLAETCSYFAVCCSVCLLYTSRCV